MSLYDHSQAQVLIVGAGPTGLTLGCELARRGIPIRIVEASPIAQGGSRGKGLQPRSLEVFDNLGIVEEVIANGRMAMPIAFGSDSGSTAKRPTEPVLPTPSVPYPASLITPQWRVEESLRKKLAELGCTVEMDAGLMTFEQSNDSVKATIIKDGRLEVIETTWLVACDGGHSLVRRLAGIAFEGDTREAVRMVVADVEVDGIDQGAWHMWRHREGFLSLCPLPSTELFQLQASISPGQDASTTLENFRTLTQQRSGHADIQLNRVDWSSLWRANVRLADRYRAGRVFLAGDAAHVHSPAGGLGMNTGIQDAANLGWKLASVIEGATPTLLDSYEDERRPVAARVLAMSDARLKQAIEQNAIPTTRDASTMQLDINYRGSTLAWDDRSSDAQLRGGDRAPDATDLQTADGPRRLFDLTRGSRFTLLDFGNARRRRHVPGCQTLRIAFNGGMEDDEVLDDGGHLAQAYCPLDGSLVLIRPDGYVGLISDSGDWTQVDQYLAVAQPALVN